MKCWVVLYFHRHGTDAWPVFQVNRPTEKKIIAELQEEWEGDTRDDEWIEIRGPWKIPEKKK